MIAKFTRIRAVMGLLLGFGLLLQHPAMAQIKADSISVEQKLTASDVPDLHSRTLVTSGYIWRVLGVTTLLLVLLLIGLRAYRKLNGFSAGFPMMQIIARSNIGPKQSLIVVAIDGRRLLLGVTEQQIQLITELDEQPADLMPVAKTGQETEGFKALLKRIGSTVNVGP